MDGLKCRIFVHFLANCIHHELCTNFGQAHHAIHNACAPLFERGFLQFGLAQPKWHSTC